MWLSREKWSPDAEDAGFSVGRGGRINPPFSVGRGGRINPPFSVGRGGRLGPPIRREARVWTVDELITAWGYDRSDAKV